MVDNLLHLILRMLKHLCFVLFVRIITAKVVTEQFSTSVVVVVLKNDLFYPLPCIGTRAG